MAGRALAGYASSLEDTQAQADRALAHGRDALARLSSSQGRLSAARAFASAQQPSGAPVGRRLSEAAVPAPDPSAVAAAVRNHAAAQTRLAQTQAQVGAAQDDLDAARRLALAARAMRQEAEETAVHALHAASEAGIRNKKWWQRLGSEVAAGWHALVAVAKVVVVALGIIALIIGGPLGWVVFAAALIVLADTLLGYGRGEASLWDVALAALACVPMTKGLTSLGEIRVVLAGGEGLLGVGRLIVSGARGQIADMTAAVRGLARGAKTIVKGLPGAFADSVMVLSGVSADGIRVPLGIGGDTSPLRDLFTPPSATHMATTFRCQKPRGTSPCTFQI